MFNQLDENVINEFIRPYCFKDPELVSKETRFSVWGNNKKHLFNLLGNKLIVEKEVNLKMDEDVKHRLFYNLYDMYYDFIGSIVGTIKTLYTWKFKDNNPYTGSLFSLLYSTDALMNNKYNYDQIIFTPSDRNKENLKPFSISKGEKLMKVFKKLIEKCNFDKKENIEKLGTFEYFRIEHSKLLNTNNIEGTLCLSIHPLDFATLSDNTYNWSSCMSWEKNGCYRTGTLEMMNSDCIVIGYLKRKETYKNWNSKVWRCLFAVTNDIIASIKPYPYYSSELIKECLIWIKELAIENTSNKDWRDDINTIDFTQTGDGGSNQTADGEIYLSKEDRLISCEFSTYWMYNDCYLDDHKCFIREVPSNPIYVDMSGPATCIECGCYLEEDDIERVSSDYDIIKCVSCTDLTPCAHCDRLTETSSLSSEGLCEYCAERKKEHTCENCQDNSNFEENIYISVRNQVPRYPRTLTSFYVCEKCFNKLKDLNLCHIRSSFWNDYYIDYKDISEIIKYFPKLKKTLEECERYI